MVYLYTSFIMLPLHRNDRMEPRQCLAYAKEIADFYRMQIVAKKFRVGGKKGGSVRFPETRHFFFWPYVNLFSNLALKHFRFVTNVEGKTHFQT